MSDTKNTFDIHKIMEYLPHRYPFLMIDRVIDLVRGEECTCIKCVTINESHFQGHFPSQAVMPGVLIVEAMAQASAFLCAESLEKNCKDMIVYFMSIDQCKFRKPVVPGDVLHIKVKQVKRRGFISKISGVCLVDDTLVAEAVLTAMIKENA